MRVKSRNRLASILLCSLMLVLCLAVLPAALPQKASAAGETYIKDFSNFPAYPYNTSSYMSGGAYVGCGPTSGAMYFGYFAYEYSVPGLLTSPGAGVNEGLQTAWTLHGSAYENTNAAGFGNVLDIKPGLEGYAQSKGYSVKVMIHVSPFYDPASGVDCSSWNAYGAYGDAWTNDGGFWVQPSSPSGKWEIDAAAFCTWANAQLANGTCIQLTVSSSCAATPDHWVPMVGFRDDPTNGWQYGCYDTWDTSVQWHDITYVYGANPHCWAISTVRTIQWTGGTGPGPISPVPELPTALLFGMGVVGVAGVMGLMLLSRRRLAE